MGMGPLRQSPTKPPSWKSMKEDMQAYHRLQGYFDQIIDTTPHDCELCNLNYGGFEMIMHLHFGHNLDYSDVCPCDDCILVKLNKSIDEEREQREALARIGEFFAASEQDESVQTAAAPEVEMADSPVFLGDNPVFNSQPVSSTPVAQHPIASVAMDVETPQQHYAPIQTSPSLSAPMAAKRPQQQYAPVQASTSLSAPTKYGIQGNLAPMGSSPVIRIDSMSPTPNLPSSFTPAETSQINAMPAVVKPTQHTRVDSAVSAQSFLNPPVVAKPSLPAMSKPKQVTTKPKLVPDNITFFQFKKEISEKNLPYEVSKIECGEMYEDNGRIIWAEKVADAPLWLDGNDNPVKSVVTHNNMRWCPCLPHNIPRDTPAWQLTVWYREAAAEGYTIRHQDLRDRGLDLTGSGITGRVQKWQSGIGMLSQARSTFFNWPSRQAMDTVAGLNYNQARFNTWWDVGFAPSRGVWMALQPSSHPGYRDLATIATKDIKDQQPYYFIQNPETRKVSEYIKLVDDAMLFLTIKAEECGMTGGYQELLPWFSKPAEDQWTKDLEADLILEFGRWREGCRDTPSVAVLRTALAHAGSVAEVEAIKRADYSLTPWLQNVVVGLAPLKQLRSAKDAQKKDEFAKKVAKRVGEKRKVEEVDDVEIGAGQSKKLAV